ncbi:hypothetical protein [Fusibacter sp. 3D3]|uniref:hypothetical protein n=1 Tax=Fusibacter sp. 3D3 TaxID=1048380 RepID=UPI000853E6BD|nr:hypothetical protein [Fusibacter sp. 3D3]GAU79645.1 hypothetical protein F3D3_4309 [Fusibacter sp. 3D3]
MFRLWGQIVKKNNIVQNYVFEMDNEDLSFEKKLFKGIEDLCNRFDIANPIWMQDNTLGMKQVNKTRFKAQHFIEEIDFDYFEIEYLVEKV